MFRKGILVLSMILALICLASVAMAEPGDSMGDPIVLALNTPITNHMDDSDEFHYYQITLPTAGYISVGFSNKFVDSNKDLWQMAIYIMKSFASGGKSISET